MTGTPASVLENINVVTIGVDEELAEEVRELLHSILRAAGAKMNLATLDEVTFAADYKQALLDLDRG